MIQHGIERMAKWIFQKLQKSSASVVFFPKSVQQDMYMLGEEKDAYYMKKISNVCILLVVGAGILGIYIFYSYLGTAPSVTELQRPEAYEKSEDILLKAGKQHDIFSIEVEPVQWTKEKADEMLLQAAERLEAEILGKNQDFMHIEENLALAQALSGYPFSIEWESDREDLIDSYGEVHREGLTQDTIVTLTAFFYYRDWQWTRQFAVVLKKEALTETEQYKKKLEQFLEEAQAADTEEDTWQLPQYLGEEALQYQIVTENSSIWILMCLLLVAAVAVWFGQDQDLHRERIKRQEHFRMEYISFAESISLYLSAGLTLPMAMQLCTQDYIKRKPEGHLLRAALIEFQKNIRNGYSFLEAMEHLAETADDMNYRRMAGLFQQGMLHGTQDLAQLLETEVRKIREEKRRQSKVAGEKVSTALIAPMMLQLGMVIVLIMIPAFSSMQF